MKQNQLKPGSSSILNLFCTLLLAVAVVTGSTVVAQDAAAPAAVPALAAAPAAAPAVKARKSDEVTVITADRLLYDYKNAFAVFEDNVVVIDPGLKLTSDKLLVRFDEKGEVEFIEAKGQVYIQTEGLTARSEVATYDVKKATIVLQVNPVVQREGAMLTGDKVIYYRDEGRLECFPNARLIIPSDQRGENLGGN
ncbi:MAG: lipopolysaccharide transport protein LptA [Candidatus Omnitrophota bacterium]|jgi:lipopolysaccharide transport protein LptA